MADKRITDVDFVDSLNSDESFFINQNSSIKQINKSNVIFGITNGGTGATTAEEARINLGAADKEHIHSVDEITNLNDTLNNIMTVKQDRWNVVDGTDIVDVTLADSTVYNYNDVTSLTIVGTTCRCYGTITFSSSTPTINVSGFDYTIGDDIAKATTGETWEFSVSYNSNNKSCIIWKSWSE